MRRRRGYGMVLAAGFIAALALAAAVLYLMAPQPRVDTALYQAFRDVTLQLRQAVEQAAQAPGTPAEAEATLWQTCTAINQTLRERGMRLQVLELRVAPPGRTVTLAYRVWCGRSFLQNTLQASGSGTPERPLEVSLTPAWANWTYELAADTIVVKLPSRVEAYVLVGYVLQNLGSGCSALIQADPSAVWIEVDGFRYQQTASTFLGEGEVKEVKVLWHVPPGLESSVLQAWPEGSVQVSSALAIWERLPGQLAGEASPQGQVEVSG